GTRVLRGRARAGAAWDEEIKAAIQKGALPCVPFSRTAHPRGSGVLTSTRPIQRHARVSYSSLIQTPACASGIDARFLRLRSRSLSETPGRHSYPPATRARARRSGSIIVDLLNYATTMLALRLRQRD